MVPKRFRSWRKIFFRIFIFSHLYILIFSHIFSYLFLCRNVYELLVIAVRGMGLDVVNQDLECRTVVHLVNGSSDIRKLLSLALDVYSYRVVDVPSVGEAFDDLSKCSGGVPDVVLLGIAHSSKASAILGYAQMIREQFGVPVVVVSPSRVYARQAARCGVNAYVHLPVPAPLLVESIERARGGVAVVGECVFDDAGFFFVDENSRMVL